MTGSYVYSGVPMTFICYCECLVVCLRCGLWRE